MGRVARGRQWILHSTATLAVTEPGNGSFVFDSLVPFFIMFLFPLLVLLLCGKGTAFWEETIKSPFLLFEHLFGLNIVFYCSSIT